MTKNIIEKAQCKAKISKCPKTALKLLNIILYASLKHLSVETSRARLARQISRSMKTVDRLLQVLQSLGLLKVISGKDDWTFNIYIPNPTIFDLAHEFKDILFSLKQYVYESTNSFLAENVAPYIDNIRNRFFSFSSSSIFFKNKGKNRTFPLEVRRFQATSTAKQADQLTFGEDQCNKAMFCSMLEAHEPPVNKLTEEEAEEFFGLGLKIPEIKQWYKDYILNNQ